MTGGLRNRRTARDDSAVSQSASSKMTAPVANNTHCPPLQNSTRFIDMADTVETSMKAIGSNVYTSGFPRRKR